MFIEPMYALPVPNVIKYPKKKPFILVPGLMVAEEKYDGIRLISEISNQTERLFVNKGVTCWTRYGNDHTRKTSDQILEGLSGLPDCIIDGELIVPGKRSYGTMTIENTPDQIYYVFDILQIEGSEIIGAPYHSRRALLSAMSPKFGPMVKLAPTFDIDTWDDVYALRDTVYARDGEGLILKNKKAPYSIGKRPVNTWIKIKQLMSDPFIVVGWEPSRGEKVDRGPYGMTKLRDAEGNFTQVKTKNDEQCRRFEERGRQVPHPDLGRTLWCEYQERTLPDNSYRHIRWDRWDKE